MNTEEELKKCKEALRLAVQLAQTAIDWNLDEVEIDGEEELVSVHYLQGVFERALDSTEGETA